jgi:hypothetical protein
MAVLAGMVLAGFAVNGEYVKECVVVDVTAEAVTVQTPQGDYYEFFGDGFSVGDEVKVTFHDNETVGIQDDFIIDAELI